MATYFVENTQQLEQLIINKISKGLLEYISKKVVNIMRKNLDDSEISTRTLQRSVSYTINNAGNESTIAIDYDMAQSFAEPPYYDEDNKLVWGHLTTSLGPQFGSQKWNGERVSFRLAKWLEYGGNGSYGNQPILASNWFSKTEEEVKSKIKKWVNDYLIINKII